MSGPLLLAIDAGNTNTVFAVFEGETELGLWRTATKTERTSDEYAVWLNQVLSLRHIDCARIEEAIIASVVPQALFDLRMMCRNYLGSEPLVVGEPGVELGIELLIDNPSEAGADRLVNAIGGYARHGGPLIVIDFGTATTFDVVDAEGNFCGGAFAPGISLSLEAMHRVSARLPRIGVRRPERVIGRDTVACMESGVYWGYVSLIEGMVERIQAEFGAPLKVVATGGLAPLFNAATDAIRTFDPDITVRGLYEVYRRNRTKDEA